MRRLMPVLAALLALTAVRAEVAVVDDTGRTVRLAQPATRIVALAPHVTETLFAAGAGPRVVAVVRYSDWPPEARALPQVGSYTGFDLEAIVALKPDLVIGWDSGNPAGQLAKLEALGVPVYRSEPRSLEDVAAALERYGVLAGSTETARQAAEDFRVQLAALRAQYRGRAPLRVFYQVWDEPLVTLNGEHLVGRLIRECGGVNVFAGLSVLAPHVSVEAVLAADPEAIVASGMAEERPEWLARWKRWPQLTAARLGNLFSIPPDLVQRHGPRVLEGLRRLCGALDQARHARDG